MSADNRAGQSAQALGDGASWVIVSRETGAPLLETFNRETAHKAMKAAGVRVVAIRHWLAEVNRAAKTMC